MIYAGTGEDSVDGGSGDDWIEGSTGNDTLLGGSGDDTISGFTGQDVIDGGSGDDTIAGGDHGDTIYGGSGNDQIDAGRPIPLVCTVRKRGDAMVVDWTGSAPQVKGAINNTWSYTAAMSFTAVKSVLSINMPNNDGVFRPIEVIAPPGTITISVITLRPSCHARPFPPWATARVKLGTMAALIAPSANRSLRTLGSRKAMRKASMASPAPNRYAST